MPGYPKKGTYREFWNCGPPKIQGLHQNCEYIYIYICIFIHISINICKYDNIYGPAWGCIQSFPRKGLFLRGGIVKQGADIYIYRKT